MVFSKVEEQFLNAVRLGKANEAAKMLKEKIIAEGNGVEILSAATYEAAKACQPATLELTAAYYWGGSAAKDNYQMYSKSYTQDGSKTCHSGLSAWSALVRSGQSPDSGDFMKCAKILASLNVGLNVPLTLDGGRAGQFSYGLIHELAARGWLCFAKDVEKWKGEALDADGEWNEKKSQVSPLGFALIYGHGDFAVWLDSKGAKQEDDTCTRGIRGFTDPVKISNGGAYHEPTYESKLLGLRFAVHAGGLPKLDSYAVSSVEDEPLASKPSLAAWFMMRGARAQARGISNEKRVRAAALVMVDFKFKQEKSSIGKFMAKIDAAISAQSEAASAGTPSPEDKTGFFSRFAKSKAEAIKVSPEVAEILEGARVKIAKRASSAPDILKALAAIDRSDFDAAKPALVELDVASRNKAAVALLGLAKMGFWDMPAIGSVGDSGRNPQRWAGFKICVALLGPAIDSPIQGLSGLSLMGACSALGWSDACAALLDAGASPDGDALTETCSPLSLAIKYGNFEIAKALVQAGASPLEGAKPSAFGLEPKAWALHAAFDAKRIDLMQAMLDADPRCAALPDPSGKTIFERSLALCEADSGQGDAFAQQTRSMSERAGMRSAIDIPSRSPKFPEPDAIAVRAPNVGRSSSL